MQTHFWYVDPFWAHEKLGSKVLRTTETNHRFYVVIQKSS